MNIGSGGIRTHAPEETGALNQRLRPLGHATFWLLILENIISIILAEKAIETLPALQRTRL